MTLQSRAFIILALITVFTGSLIQAGYAQQNRPLPQLPKPIQNLVDEGAQIRYLGNQYNMDGWLTIKNGQEQYFYVQPDGKSFVMGLMFDNSGQVVTVDQVNALRESEGEFLDGLTDDFALGTTDEVNQQDRLEFKSPSEQLFYDIENSNWIPLGQPGAPIMYSFIDPQCPHCHAMLTNLKENYIDTGRMQLRIIPVGFRDETRAQSAYLLAAPNPQERLWRHLEGDESALPVRPEINQQGVQRNLALMQSWKLSVTPLSLYRAKDQSIKIIRGQPQDISALVNDLGGRV